MDIVYFAVSVLAVAGTVGARCPGLGPPLNGVLKCQGFQRNMLCRVTCYAGYEFQTGQRIIERTCLDGADTWLEGPAMLPDCVQHCDDSLMTAAGSVVSASSSLTDNGTASLTQPAVWRPARDDILQFIQVDLGSSHVVRGWTVRGDTKESYVRLFRILFSQDAVAWTSYSDGRVMDKFFTGSFDAATEVTQLLSVPQTTRYVRVNPLAWADHIALRLDLLGCPLTAQSQVCTAPLPPDDGAVNCERNGTHVICTAYCLDKLVFQDRGPAIEMTCDPKLDRFTNSPLPSCVARNTSGQPLVNISGPCLQSEHDCFQRPNGNYQYCGDCHYFATCSEEYFFVRACPEHLQYDGHRALCDYSSGTCVNSKRRVRFLSAPLDSGLAPGRRTVWDH